MSNTESNIFQIFFLVVIANNILVDFHKMTMWAPSTVSEIFRLRLWSASCKNLAFCSG